MKDLESKFEMIKEKIVCFFYLTIYNTNPSCNTHLQMENF